VDQYLPPAEFCDAAVTSAPGPKVGNEKSVGPAGIADYEAVALHRTLMVAKFKSDIDNVYVGRLPAEARPAAARRAAAAPTWLVACVAWAS
jgi:hypothetical protein